MGVQESKSNDFKWIDKYELIDMDYNDKVLKLMSRVGESEYIGKEFICNGDDQIRKIEQLVNKKMFSPSPFLMKLLKVGTKMDHNYCNNSKVFYLVFQKPFQNLKQQTINRKIKHLFYSQQQIQCLLQTCVKALHYLHEMGEPHTNISSSSIFIRQDRTIILGDPWLTSAVNNRRTSYPSPERILYLNGLVQTQDELLSDLFSLGVLILQIIFLEHMDLLYEQGYRRIIDTKVIEKIIAVKSINLNKKLRILLSHQNYKRKEIFKYYNCKQTMQRKFISLQRQSFRKNYIRQHLQTSHVKTVKEGFHEKQHTIINQICQSRNPSEVSMVTIQQNKNYLQFGQNHQSNRTIKINSNMTIPKIHFQNVPYNLQQTPFVQIPSSSSISFNPRKPVIKQQPKKQIKLANDKQSVQFNHNQTEKITDNKMQLSSIHQHSSHNDSQEMSNIQITNEPKKDNNDVKQSIKNQQNIKLLEHFEIKGEDDNFSQVENLKKMLNANYGNTLERKQGKILQPIEQNEDNHYPFNKREYSTIKQMSEQSPSKDQIDPNTGEHSIVYETGARYKGTIKNGMRQGYGIFYYKDRSYYKGLWKENKMHGRGSLFYQNDKLIYEGNWYMDCFHGHGTLFNHEPTNLDHTYNYKDFTDMDDYWESYQGQFFGDKKNGRGKLKLTNGEIYIGLFDDNKICGVGKFYKNNGQIVMGHWKDDKLISLI